MAYIPPLIPYRIVKKDDQMTLDDQRIITDASTPITVDLPADVAEAARRTRRFVLINGGSGMANWRGPVEDSGTGNTTMITVTVPPQMFREAIPYPSDDNGGSAYYVFGAAQKNDTRGVNFVDKNGVQLNNVRTVVLPFGTLADNGNSQATFTPDTQFPVTKVNGKTGDVVLGASDVGAASLVNGKVPSSQLPAIAIGETFSVATQAAMLALTAQTGDVAIRTDLGGRRFLLAGDSTQLSSWISQETPDAVTSVQGKTGAVVLAASDVGAIATTATITDAQHGDRSGGVLHALATQSTHGFMDKADKKKLDAIGVTAFRAGTADIPAMVLGGNANVTVTFNSTFPSSIAASAYVAVSSISSTLALANFTVTEVSRTLTSITYNVKSAGLLAVGSKLSVIASAEVPV